jgi:hypothetical protein
VIMKAAPHAFGQRDLAEHIQRLAEDLELIIRQAILSTAINLRF